MDFDLNEKVTVNKKLIEIEKKKLKLAYPRSVKDQYLIDYNNRHINTMQKKEYAVIMKANYDNILVTYRNCLNVHRNLEYSCGFKTEEILYSAVKGDITMIQLADILKCMTSIKKNFFYITLLLIL